ncbi:ABC transporter ATP-binding protein [bacterium]|nr:ABC transporter ATP-binding protein [bacterium]
MRDNSQTVAATLPNDSSPILEARDVTKSFQQGRRTIDVLRGVDIAVHPGEFVAVVGPSGAGKSTLLHILGTLERPTSGTLKLLNHDVASMSGPKRAELRRGTIGFVFQFHHLLPAFTALENVMMPARVRGVSAQDASAPAQELLDSLGLGHRLENKPAELSGGEQQRVAVARALMNDPKLILADEPTGNLDRPTGRKLETDLINFVQQRGSSIVVVTHNEDWAERADRVVRLVDGRIEDARPDGSEILPTP